ncbi:hypothetical protein BJ322DRAFT_1108324 [Thelephora terrestris]|uniref:NACHT domain-containing protein n=1 Tax=Thelephora terrestris TaxID=56493 RepID=A0A9P6L897_9AGAM|nr:hypothetical protein BJ322DRAFT_1108324 [Thelephora terrestris]
MFKRKSKKRSKPPTNLLLGIPTHIAVSPLRFRAEIDTDPQDENNPGPSRIVFGESGSEAAVPGTSIAVAIDDVEPSDQLTKENISHTRRKEGNAGVASKIPEEDRRGVRKAPLITTEAAKESGFGPLKALLGAISAVHTDREGTIAARNQIAGILPRVTSLDAHFATRPYDVTELKRRGELIHKLKAIEGQLRLLHESQLQQLAHHVQGDKDVSGPLEDLEEAIFHYQMERRSAIDGQGFKQIDPAEATALNNFHCAQQAEFRHGNRNGCLKGTRRDVLAEIELWAQEFHKPPVYWLNGLAGTGKSTIAQTIAEKKFADGQLGASFFCSRDFEDRSNLQFILPTLAVQLARTYADFRSIFVPLVRSDPGVAYESLYGQMNKLIVQPLAKSAISTVIVIDALDECKDNEPASAILSVLGQFVAKIPKVKFFITGRPELRIREGFRLPLLADATDVFVLHEVEPSRINNDIQLFFRHTFSELKARRRVLLDDWPTEEQLNTLCDRAGGLFVHAVATVRFIDLRNNNPKRQLNRLLQSPENSALEGKTKFGVNTTLDLLYMTILHEAFGDDDPEGDPRVRSVLGAVVLSANPLSPSTIATLLGLDAEDVLPILSSIHSLLVLREEDVNHVARPFHKSFPDFIVDTARCTNPRFRVSPPDQHAELLIGCLELMDQRLELNMCKLPDGVMNSEVADLRERTEKHINKALEYACRSWYRHLLNTTQAQTLKIIPILRRFLEKDFLSWLEVLSVLGAAREAIDTLEATAGWLNDPPTLELVRDYLRFVITFFEVISTSAPHIYISALPLSPQSSLVRGLYKQYARPLARVVQGLPTSWEPVVTATRKGIINDVAWSPCNRFIAIISATVEIIDAVTLKQLNTFESPPISHTPLLGFSPDGHTLTMFNDGMFMSWDLQTGGPAGTVHSEGLTLFLMTSFFSSTYSTDGKMLAVLYQKASPPFIATYDPLLLPTISFIATHDLLSRTRTHTYPVPEGKIVIPIWTHGECLRFATLKSGSITIWEAAFTSTHPPAEVESFPAPDEIAHGKDFLFFPALSLLAFAHQGSILVWDVKASKFLLNSGPTPVSDRTANLHSHRSSFSSDGRFFACLTAPREVSVWKVSSAGYTLHQKLTFPSEDVRKGPHLSPNGESVVVVLGSAIHLWHTKDQDLSLSGVPSQRHTWESSILVFSPEETLAALVTPSGNTITILDLWSGDPQLAIDTGMEVVHLGMTGNTIVAVGRGKAITWNIPEKPALNATADVKDSIGVALFDRSPLTLNHQKPTGTSISPDSSRVIIWGPTKDQLYGGLEIYDLSSGRCLAGVRGPRKLASASFAPDGLEVWGNDFSSVLGWKVVEDSESGTTKLEPLEPTRSPPKVLPSKSSCGHEIMHDGWIISPTKKRLLWLPNHWRSNDWLPKWGRRFLGLKRCGTSDVVILEFFE